MAPKRGTTKATEKREKNPGSTGRAKPKWIGFAASEGGALSSVSVSSVPSVVHPSSCTPSQRAPGCTRFGGLVPDRGEGGAGRSAQSFAQLSSEVHCAGCGAMTLVAVQLAAVRQGDQRAQAQASPGLMLGERGDGRAAGAVERGEAGALGRHGDGRGPVVER